MGAWHETPNINAVYEALKRLTRGGEAPVGEVELVSHMSREERPISSGELAKALMVLEALGYIEVYSSTKEERLIKLVKHSI